MVSRSDRASWGRFKTKRSRAKQQNVPIECEAIRCALQKPSLDISVISHLFLVLSLSTGELTFQVLWCFCNSAFADRRGVAASRSFSAASACVVLGCFASQCLQIAAVAEKLAVVFFGYPENQNFLVIHATHDDHKTKVP